MAELRATGQLPPFDENAEKALLGSVLLNSKLLEDIGDILRGDHFYDSRHALVFSLVVELWSSSRPVDILTVLDLLKLKGDLNPAFAAEIDKEYLLELIAKSSLLSSATSAAKIIRDKYFLRELINISDKIKSKSLDEKDRVEDVLEYAQKEIYQISEQNIEKNFTPIGEVLTEVYERISNAKDSGQLMSGTPTGLTEIDALLGGFHAGDLIILAARPSMGKTSLALEVVRRMAISESTGVAIFSLEMGKDQLVDKLLSSTAGIELRKIRNGQLENQDGNDEFMKLGEAMGTLNTAKIWIDDSGHLNITELRTKARRLKSRYNIGLLVIDYLQLMSGNSGTNYGVNRVQEVSDISRNLKMLAKELEVPVLALSQLSRGVESREDKRPMLSDLRESGSIEQDADVVMFVHRDEMYNKESKNKGKANIIIAKHRNGETGTAELAWIGKLATFGNLEGGRTTTIRD
jgi:replicative DNA helicase